MSACRSFTDHVQDEDELTAYMSETVKAANCELRKPNNGVVDYWLTKRGSFPNLSRVALILLATQASSASRERDFSLLKMPLSKNKFKLKEEFIDAKVVLHSHLKYSPHCNK